MEWHLDNQMAYAMADVVTMEVLIEDLDESDLNLKNTHRILAMEIVLKHLKEILNEAQDRIDRA